MKLQLKLLNTSYEAYHKMLEYSRSSQKKSMEPFREMYEFFRSFVEISTTLWKFLSNKKTKDI